MEVPSSEWTVWVMMFESVALSVKKRDVGYYVSREKLTYNVLILVFPDPRI